MRKPNYVYLAGLVLLSALLIAAIQWGQLATLLILALLVIFAIGYPSHDALLIWWRFRPIRKLTVGQDTGTIRAQFESRWAGGKHTPYNATVLSFLCYQQKRYPDAEQYPVRHAMNSNGGGHMANRTATCSG
jgi:hypothetical protein